MLESPRGFPTPKTLPAIPFFLYSDGNLRSISWEMASVGGGNVDDWEVIVTPLSLAVWKSPIKSGALSRRFGLGQWHLLCCTPDEFI